MLSTDPVCLTLTTDGDIAISADGRTSLASGLTAAVQGARARMGLIRGEWFLDLSVGVPYLERDGVTASAALLGQVYDPVKVRTEMRKAILSTPGVIEIILLTVELDPTTRAVTVTWRAKTLFGDTETDILET
jgi:hypothetical protein